MHAVAAGSSDSTSHLAFLGDKSILLSKSGRSFLMYAVEQRAWLAMGEPVGPPDDAGELIWQFNKLADRHDGWSCLYAAGSGYLNLYLDVGLSPLPIGQRAGLRLEAGWLEDPARAEARANWRTLAGADYRLRVLAAPPGEADLTVMEEISRAQMAARGRSEQGFAVGCFDRRYVSHFPVAMLEKSGRTIGFAVLWPGGRGEAGDRPRELGVDLLRLRPESPPESLDFMFLQAGAWAAEQGYGQLSLGLLPPSPTETGTPPQGRLSTLAYTHAEHFALLQDLRAYKLRLAPQLEMRYLVVPGGLAPFRVYPAIAAILARGPAGISATNG